MDLSPLLAPLFLLFEFWQLVMAERYLGIARIEKGVDPRRLPMRTGVAAFWSVMTFAEWLWLLVMLAERSGRAAALCMIAVSLGGYFLRRRTSLKWTLVILTFEGAIRIGMMLFVIGAWIRGAGGAG